jgi:hypothetical protein
VFIQQLAMAGFPILFAISTRTGDPLGPAPFWTLGAVIVATSLWSLTWGVDLTPESANLRWTRRRSIPWQEVQAVVRYDQTGSSLVPLTLEDGKRVTLRAPTRVWGLGGAAYDRDFHRIDQWWLAHRGESWRPLLPEAPRNPYALPDTR